MSEIVLDASALIAMLKEEPGGEQVRSVLSRSRLSAANLAEVVSHFVRLTVPADELTRTLDQLPLRVVVVDQSIGALAGRMIASTGRLGLSLGDRICLATAKLAGAQAMTADRAWRDVAELVGVEVVTIR